MRRKEVIEMSHKRRKRHSIIQLEKSLSEMTLTELHVLSEKLKDELDKVKTMILFRKMQTKQEGEQKH
jgi:hypothetical protein